MSDKDLQPPTTLPRAPLGSKAGWPVVTAQVPPGMKSRVAVLAARRGMHLGDVVHEAVEQYLDREAA